jgi:hypothetical protein
MKAQADKNRQEREFQVGDWVYMKLQPYDQMTVQHRANHKLSYKFFGPYLVLQKVGLLHTNFNYLPVARFTLWFMYPS